MATNRIDLGEIPEPTERSDLCPVTQEQLDRALEHHQEYLKKRRGGVRAVFKMCDLTKLNLSNKDLSEIDFTGSRMIGANLRNARAKGAIFFCSDLTRARMTNVRMARVDFRGVRLRQANLDGAALLECDLRDGILLSAHKGEIRSVLEAETASSQMSELKARGSDLSGSKLSSSFLVQSDLTDAVMRKVKFIRANLTNANLTGTNLEGADLSEANLEGAVLHGALLSNAILNSTNLKSADLVGAILDEVDLSVATNAASAKTVQRLETMPESLRDGLAGHLEWIKTGGKSGKRLDLSKVDLSGQDLSELNLSGAIFRFAIMRNVKLMKTSLVMSDFTFADLRGANFNSGDLRGVSMSRVTASDAQFVATNLNPVPLEGSSIGFWPTQMDRARLNNADLQGAEMESINLEGASLTKANMRGANLMKANLMDAMMDGADTRGARMQGADTRGALGLDGAE